MRHIDITAALEHGQAMVRALTDALACADGGPSVQRTLALPGRDRSGASWTSEVVLRLQRMDDA